MSRQLQEFEATMPDKQALASVLKYLKQQNLKGTEEALKKELGIHGDVELDNLAATVPSAASLSGAEPAKYEESYSSLVGFVERSLDMYRTELSLLLYPVFVHLYLDLIFNGHVIEAQSFFGRYHMKQEPFYDGELLRLKSITTPEQMLHNDLVESFRKNKFTIRISNDSFQCLVKHLQVNQHTLILNIINQFLHLDVFDGTPRSRIDIRASTGAVGGEAAAKVNKARVLYGIPRDPDVAAALAELEEEENENNMDDEKPKKKKPKKDYTGIKKGKATTAPNAPLLNRILLPKLRDCEQAAKFTAFKESAKCIPVGPSNLPSICFYTLLNTYHGLNAVSISDDSTLLAGSFNDSIIRIWTLTPKKLCPLKTPNQMNQVTLAAEDVLERLVDTTNSSDLRQLTGHCGPVYSTSFNPDNTFLVSGSEDGTIRLWSLQTYTALVCFKGHNYPVWSVEFSYMGFYFVTGSYDKTARIWSTEQIQPLRILAGHLGDVDCCKFHPNGNYVATGSCDRTVRLWDMLSGLCVRIFTGHKGAIYTLAFSPDGKLLASSGADKRILVWDIGNGTQVYELKRHTDIVYQLSFSRDGTILASGGLDNCVKLWDTSVFEDSGKDGLVVESLLGSYPTKTTHIQCLHFTRKNLLLAAGPINV